MPSPWSETGGHHGPPVDPGPLPPLRELATDWARRVEAVTATLDRVERESAADEGTHGPECYLAHTVCLAARLRRQLTGEVVGDGGV